MTRTSVAVGVVTLAICLAGCGGGKYSSPKATMETLRAATAAGDDGAAMACLSETSHRKLAEMNKMFDDFVKAHPELAGKVKRSTPADGLMDQAKGTMTYGEEKITGETGHLDVVVDRETFRHGFVREDGEWKIELLISDDATAWIKRGLDMLLKANEGLKDAFEKRKKSK